MRGVWRALAAASLVLAGGVVATAVASAASFTVTRFDDPVPDACAPSDCSLREAVIAANTTGGDDTITLAPGTYTLTIPDATEAGNATDGTQGDLDVTDTLTLQSSGGGGVTIDAGARFSVGASSISVTQPGTGARVLHVASTTLTLNDVTITGGSGDEGAGVQVESGGRLAATGGAVRGNVANGARCCGGGIGAVESFVDLTGTAVTDNAVGQCCGGGIYNESSGVRVIGGSVSGNDAFGCCGAGIYNWSAPFTPTPQTFERHARLFLSNVTVSGNDVRDCCGGGMYNEQGSPVWVDIVGSSFSNNAASDDCCGGAIYSKFSAGVTATDTSFSGNTTAACCGGAVYSMGGFNLTRGSITNNSVVNCCGGGVAAFGSGSATVLTNVTVSGNSAGVEPSDGSLPSAGGLYLDDAGGTMVLEHATVAGNSGSNAASGIANGDVGTSPAGRVRMRRSIVADNLGAPQCRGPVISEGYNIASDGSCSLTQPTDRPSTSPHLAGLSAGFHALGSGSPALDAIPLDQCPPPGTDQRGVVRPQDHADAPGNGCDIGAVEMAGGTATPTPTPSATPTSTPAPTTTPTPASTATPTTPTPSPGTTTPTPSASPGTTPTPTASASPSPTPTPEPIDPRCDDPGVVCGTDGSETIRGTDDGELIICGDGDDVVEALGGDDTIECGDAGDTGDKTVRAGAGDDEVTCDGAGDDDVRGGAGNDEVDCGAGNDRIGGGSGNDRLASRGGRDVILGGAGRDRISGRGGADTLRGGRGNDVLRGGRGRDRLFGDAGGDVLLAGAGRDFCDADPGDRLRGCERIRRTA